jgi:hypothetical protein
VDDDCGEEDDMDATRTGRVRVPREVFDGIEAVRKSGLTNMLDRPVVARLAGEMGYEEAARWVRLHRDLYSRAIFHGLRIEEEGEEE